MHELNAKLKALTEEMWKIKDFKEDISVQELLDFCDEFCAYQKFWRDLIDSRIITGGLTAEEKDKVVNVLRRLNGNTYDCLIIDDLMELDCESGKTYLREIINTPELYATFQEDFKGSPRYEKFDVILRR